MIRFPRLWRLRLPALRLWPAEKVLPALPQRAGRQQERRHLPELFVARHALDKIAAAAARHRHDETGEAMVGLVTRERGSIARITLLDTIAPDESALRRAHTFQQGDERQDEILWWLRENWRLEQSLHRDEDGQVSDPLYEAALGWLGDWHKQPDGMIAPSFGDLRTAHDWLDEPAVDFLLAPIVTLGHQHTVDSGGNFLLAGNARIDFWYLDRYLGRFAPITPRVIAHRHLLPNLAPLPWHLTSPELAEVELAELKQDGWRIADLVLHDARADHVLDICLTLARDGARNQLLIATPHDYPRGAPVARIAPWKPLGAGERLHEHFVALWQQGARAPTLSDFRWNPTRRLVELARGLEEYPESGLKPPPSPSTPANAAEPAVAGGENDTQPGDAP